MPRKWVIVLLALLMFALVGCGGDPSAEALEELQSLGERLSRQESNRAELLAQAAADPARWEATTWQEQMNFEKERLSNVRRDLTALEIPDSLTLAVAPLDNALMVCESFQDEIGNFEPENLDPTTAAHPACLEASEQAYADLLAFELPE